MSLSVTSALPDLDLNMLETAGMDYGTEFDYDPDDIQQMGLNNFLDLSRFDGQNIG